MEISKEQLIIQGLAENRFVFYLQPKVDLRDGKIIGAEALARLLSEDGSVIMPGDFIPVMEENGLIKELDIYIFEKVCEHFAERIRAELPMVPISVNVSALHFNEDDVYEKYASVAEKYALPPGLIEFELTETLVAEDTEGVKAFVDKARENGYSVSVDDFGSGYAGINMWRQYEVDTVKLDRNFLSGDEETQKRNLTILPDIISTSKRLGFAVISEGVETKEHCEMLLKLNCTKAQGFFFAKPMPVRDFYDRYETGDFYDLAYKKSRKKEAGKKELRLELKANKSKKNRFAILGIILLICVLFFGLRYQQNAVTSLFEDSIQNRLEEYSTSAVKEFRFKIGSVSENIEAIAYTGDEEAAKLYIESLNSNDVGKEIVYNYYAADEINNSGTYSEDNVAISIIVPVKGNSSERLLETTMPLFSDGEFKGLLNANINLNYAVGTEGKNPPFGELDCIVIVDENYKILYSSCEEKSAYKSCVFEHMAGHLDLNTSHETLENYFTSENKNNIGVYENKEGVNNFITLEETGINNWKILINYTSNESNAYSSQLSALFIKSGIVMGVASFLLLYIIVMLIKGAKKSGDDEVKLYSVLEQFSDITVFDYSIAKDAIKFSQNSKYYFDLGWTDDSEYKGFCKDINELDFIHPSDRKKVRSILKGADKDGGVANVRLKSKKGVYIWCEIEYRYIFDKEESVALAGKINVIE